MEKMQEAVKTPISVIIPAYNEEDAVGSQVESIKQVLLFHGIKHEIIVVNDGSQDQTAEIALQTHAKVLHHSENRGYGAALKTGITAAKYESILIIDADGTYPVEQIPTLVSKFENADMVVGARIGKHVHIPFIRRPAKWILGWLAARISGRPIPDLNSGMRVFRRECVKQYFSILPNGFSFTTTVTLAFFGDDYCVQYCPINYNQRIGKSKILPRHFMEFMILVFRMAMLFQPLKIFVPLAFLCSLLGVFKVVFDLILLIPRISEFGWSSLLYQPVLSTSSILLLLVGLQLLLIGMMADALLRRILRNNTPLVPSHGVRTSELRSDADVQKYDMI